ncbi:hypothetical protein [Chitinophaga barathri]|uniref:Uncharacterized protein n=2 Tax=Chitinophaga barathri TaxID=1647451 RepID=A0A3N4MLJ3_9BACT|nr:hypothetical protein [Chitinophaga barathri]RPD42936.1 hypothetical protein EG028_01175 [Chitinophaga barathri]
MKNILLLIIFVTGMSAANAQSLVPKDTPPPGSVMLAWYEGRTPCRELAAELKLGFREECAKRKLSLIFYVDSTSRKPTFFRMGGVGVRSGTGKWSIEKGMPSDSLAIVYRLDFGEAELYLMKGFEQVLFVLDNKKNFLVGNEKYSYTLNRVTEQRSWDKWRELVHRGASF